MIANVFNSPNRRIGFLRMRYAHESAFDKGLNKIASLKFMAMLFEKFRKKKNEERATPQTTQEEKTKEENVVNASAQGTPKEEAKADSKGKKQKTPSNKKAIITYSIIGTLAIGLGVGAGFLAHNFLNPVGGDYSNVDVNALTDDISKTRQKYEAAKKAGTPLEEALKPCEMANLSLDLFSSLESTKAIGIGSATSMGVTQVIQSMQIKNGEKYFEESNSTSSLVKLFDRMYQEGNNTTTYWGKSSDYSSHEAVTYTNEEYAELMGRKVSDPMIYVISSKTSITEEDKEKSGKGVSKITKENGGYTVDLELQRKKSVVNYVKQMKNISGLTGYPTFEYCHLTFHLDEDLMPLDYTSYEEYQATKKEVGISTTIKGTLTTYFYHGETYEIPTLETETQSVYESLSAN